MRKFEHNFDFKGNVSFFKFIYQLHFYLLKLIYNYIDKNMPEWAREPVQWCVDKGIIAGTGDGLGLNDMKLWMCVVLYRTVKFVGKLVGVKI